MKSPFIHLLVASLICLIALGAYGYWYAVISTKSATVTQLQSEIDAKWSTANRLTAARETLALLGVEEDLLHNHFVQEIEVADFISSLEKLGTARKTKISVLSVSTGGTPVKPLLVLSLSMEGGFSDIMRTLGTIEYEPYYLSVPSFSITKDGTAKNEVWRASAKLVVGSVPKKKMATSTPSQAKQP